jgi:predicted ATP-dependent endonuclease of OLD family
VGREPPRSVFSRGPRGKSVPESDRSLPRFWPPALGEMIRFGGLVLLIEEPELYLRPQAQRYLYRLLREFSLAGNQVIYSTHSPTFLNVTRMDELVFVDRSRPRGTHALQPEPLSAEEDFPHRHFAMGAMVTHSVPAGSG